MSAAETAERPHVAQKQALSYSEVLRFYLPLACSWLFMGLESPVSTSIIMRRPDSVTNAAGFLILMGLSLWIESPVIDLLATSTTLAKYRQYYGELSKFVWVMMTWVTVAHGLIAFTPLYTFIAETLLHAPPNVAASARIGMMIMVPWSAFIGWRRYLQGILIRYGRTRLVGIGTAVRVSTMALTALTLFNVSDLPGIVIASIALVAAVGAEATFAHVVSRSTIRRYLSQPHELPEGEPPLRQRKLMAFHLPLTATTMVTLLATPVISAALARTPQPVLAMASYQVASTLLWLHRTIAFALPEVVITLYKDEESARVLRRFSMGIGIFATCMLVFLSVTGLDMAYFQRVLDASPEVARMAHIGFLAAGFTPLIGAAQSYIRGMLTAHHLTVSRLLAVLVSMVALFVALEIGVALRWTGVIVAGFALTVALLSELGALLYSWTRREKPGVLERAPDPARHGI